jgi:hypothetical protein
MGKLTDRAELLDRHAVGSKRRKRVRNNTIERRFAQASKQDDEVKGRVC